MMNRFTLAVAAAASALMFSTAAFAGDQYIDETGFAVSGYDVVAYFDLEMNPVGQTQTPAVPGNADITAEYNGATFAFSTEENRESSWPILRATHRNMMATVPTELQRAGKCPPTQTSGGLWMISCT